jgi:hypothetical protein
MKKLLVLLFGAFALSVTLTAQAGPDWQTIEHGRKFKHATQTERHGDASIARGPTDVGLTCGAQARPPKAHGPRAQVTPQQNRAKQKRHEAESKNCEDASR